MQRNRPRAIEGAEGRARTIACRGPSVRVQPDRGVAPVPRMLGASVSLAADGCRGARGHAGGLRVSAYLITVPTYRRYPCDKSHRLANYSELGPEAPATPIDALTKQLAETIKKSDKHH
jgi:hypothetical protein